MREHPYAAPRVAPAPRLLQGRPELDHGGGTGRENARLTRLGALQGALRGALAGRPSPGRRCSRPVPRRRWPCRRPPPGTITAVAGDGRPAPGAAGAGHPGQPARAWGPGAGTIAVFAAGTGGAVAQGRTRTGASPWSTVCRGRHLRLRASGAADQARDTRRPGEGASAGAGARGERRARIRADAHPGQRRAGARPPPRRAHGHPWTEPSRLGTAAWAIAAAARDGGITRRREQLAADRHRRLMPKDVVDPVYDLPERAAPAGTAGLQGAGGAHHLPRHDRPGCASAGVSPRPRRFVYGDGNAADGQPARSLPLRVPSDVAVAPNGRTSWTRATCASCGCPTPGWRPPPTASPSLPRRLRRPPQHPAPAPPPRPAGTRRILYVASRTARWCASSARTGASASWRRHRAPGRGLEESGPARQVSLGWPTGLAWGPDGSLYIADRGVQKIFRLKDGSLTRVAGTGRADYLGPSGFSPDGRPATQESLVPRGSPWRLTGRCTSRTPSTAASGGSPRTG